MTAEILAFSFRPLFPILSFSKFNQKDRGIPLSNSEMILSIMSATLHEEPDIDGECVPVDFCDDI